jgi:glycosyltransferase involved in cell wall biosynthesis
MSAKKDTGLRILLSAYACEPGKGSEPGVGWRWACGLSERVSLSVLTREGNRECIEREIAKHPRSSALHRASFLYHDLPKPLLWAKRRSLLPTFLYYILWQWTASRRFRVLADQQDVVHHLTFCTLLCPGFWKLKRAKFVLGPVGAPLVNPHYYRLFGGKAWVQRLRGWLLRHFLSLPWLKRLLRSAAAVVPANGETRDLLISRGIAAREVMLDTGAPEIPSGPAPAREDANGCCRFIFAGRLERRKGLELSLRAFAQAAADEHFKGSFKILGDGPDRERLETLTAELGLCDYVEFAGAMAQTDVMREFQEADAFLFSSVRDTSAGVNLEAMACGLPIVCLSHQGVADITTDACALRVPPGPINDTVDGLAHAIQRIAADRDLRKNLGREAKRRAAEDFSWDAKFERMAGIYQSVGRTQPDPPTSPSSAGG